MKRLVIVLIILLGAAVDGQRGVMAGERQVDGAQPNTDENAVRAWLQTNAIRLDTVEAGRGSADLQPLRRVVGNARIVALGEATHGSREFFQLKHRLLEFLVSEMGFTVFAMEVIMPEAFDVNQYVLTGQGDAGKALAGVSIAPRLFDTHEMLDLIEWMRRYNSDPEHTRKVKFYGLDMQSAARPAKVVVGYLRKVDPQRAVIADKELAGLTNPYTAPAFVRRTSVEKAKTADFVQGILREFDSEKPRYVRRSGVADWTIARQHAELLSQHISLLQTEPGSAGGGNLRDQLMAANLRWILEQEGPSAKAVVSAHNTHVWVWNDASAPNVAMGSHLRRMFGSEMVAFGFAFNEGAFQSQEPAATPGRRLSASIGTNGTANKERTSCQSSRLIRGSSWTQTGGFSWARARPTSASKTCVQGLDQPQPTGDPVPTGDGSTIFKALILNDYNRKHTPPIEPLQLRPLYSGLLNRCLRTAAPSVHALARPLGASRSHEVYLNLTAARTGVSPWSASPSLHLRWNLRPLGREHRAW